ncbi:helix-turn-helix transcriptional regulator [Galactobacter valiniphilus]|uniref:helix-turn-helix transcriptional regulator n=1 Tax=Galactobacter valiniphilus TaxID=2676122 RepID=UPI00373576C4
MTADRRNDGAGSPPSEVRGEAGGEAEVWGADRWAVVMRSLLAVLRSPRLGDQAARVEAERLASDALVSLRRTVVAGPAGGLIPVAEAFVDLRRELAPLVRFGRVGVEFVEPPAGGRALPPPVADAARSVVRIAVLAYLAERVERVRVQWDCDGTNLLVSVRDDGEGTRARSDEALRPIAELVERVGGEWGVDSTQAWGSHLHLSLPLDRSARPGQANDDAAALAGLTSREAQAARLAATGLTNAQIATELGISQNTVKFHLSAAMRKLGVARRVELAALLAPGA